MLDKDAWSQVAKLLSMVAHTKDAEKTLRRRDAFGSLHLVVFLDFKQLPPATSQRGRRALDRRSSNNAAKLVTRPPFYRESKMRRALEANRPSFPSRASTRISTFEF